MGNLENIDKQDSKRISDRSKVIEKTLSKVKETFFRPPKIIKAFERKWRLDKCESPDRVEEITEYGKKYLKISIKPGDKKDFLRGTERAEIQQSERINYDEEYIQNFSFQIPEDFALCPRRTVIRQWKRRPEITSNDAPLLSHRIKKIDGKYYLVLTDGKVLKDGTRRKIGERIPMKDIIGKDISIENKIKFSDKGESMVCVKMGGEIIYDGPIDILHPKKNKKEGIQAYFKFGLYRDRYKYSIRKIKKDKILTEEEKKVQIEEIKNTINKEREKDSYIVLKDYKMEKSEGNRPSH